MAKLATTTVRESHDTEQMLKRLPIELRQQGLRMALRAAARPMANMAKRLAPKPGYPGDKPGKIPLNKTIKVVTRDYGDIQMAIVGATWPEGAHVHLVDQGHEVKVSRGPRRGQSPLSGASIVPGKEFMQPAADITQGEQDRRFRAKLKERIEKASK